MFGPLLRKDDPDYMNTAELQEREADWAAASAALAASAAASAAAAASELAFRSAHPTIGEIDLMIGNMRGVWCARVWRCRSSMLLASGLSIEEHLLPAACTDQAPGHQPPLCCCHITPWVCKIYAAPLSWGGGWGLMLMLAAL